MIFSGIGKCDKRANEQTNQRTNGRTGVGVEMVSHLKMDIISISKIELSKKNSSMGGGIEHNSQREIA